jgi:type I restriction enzyme S subunit
MTTFPKYDRYKDSGVEWLGEVPEHWEVRRVKSIFRMVMEPAPKDNSEELLSIYTHIGVEPRKDLEEKGNKASTTDGYWRVKVGDMIVNKLLAWMGAIGLSKYEGVTSPAYDILRPSVPAAGWYYHYLFRTKSCTSELKRHSRGIMDMRLRLYFDKFGDVLVPYPPLDEQDRIVAFLDQKTAEIDALIAKKQRQIELLDEQKAILINRAVTRGLDPNARLKPSGIEWIGEVPEGWGIARLGDQFDFISYGFTNPMPTTDFGPPMVTANDIGMGRVLFETARSTSPREFSKLSRKSRPERRDILVTKDGTLGRVGVVSGDSEFCINQSVALLRPKVSTNEEYLAALLQASSYNEQMILDAGGTTIKHIYITRLAKMSIALPPNPEQIVILAAISEILEKSGAIFGRLNKMIESLKTLRSTLIAHAVTGRIKV